MPSDHDALAARVKTLERESGGWPLIVCIFAMTALLYWLMIMSPRVRGDRVCVLADLVWPWEAQTHDIYVCTTGTRVEGLSNAR